MTTYARERAPDRIAELSGRGLDLVTFWRDATEVLRRAVPFYETPCWYTLDPASLLVTSHFHEGLDELPPEWLAHEYYEDDVNKLADVARSKRGVSTLHEATGGDPRSSPRWHFNMTMGGDQELIVALRTVTGEAWGALGLYREPGAPLFDGEELELVRSLAPNLAEGARRALLVGEATDPEGRNRRVSSSLPTRGTSSPSRRASRAGWLTFLMATGTPGACPQPSTPSPAGRCERLKVPTLRARWPSHASSRVPVRGLCCTERRSSPTGRAGWQ